MKGLLAVGAIVALIYVIGHSGSSDNSTPAATTDSDASSVSVIAPRSSCRTEPYEARLFFTVWLRNTGDTARSVDVTPVRRYSDGSRNDSIMDTLTVTVPAHSVRWTWHAYDYDATQHELLECWARIGTNNVPIRVK